MAWITKTRLKYALAGMGVVYLILFAGYLIYAGTRPDAARRQGPSELEAHPERQAEIVARRRAEELRDRLQLTEEQTQKIAEIYLRNPQEEFGDGNAREQRKAMREEIARVLTPEQQAQMEQTRGGFRGPGGPQGAITPDRMDNLKAIMTPEQRERFEKAAQRMQQMRGGPRGDGPGRGPGRDRGQERQRPQSQE